jgi:hypothetical protein
VTAGIWERAECSTDWPRIGVRPSDRSAAGLVPRPVATIEAQPRLQPGRHVSAERWSRLTDIVAVMRDETAELEVTSAPHQFSAYGPSHWAVLAVFATGSAALVWIGRRRTESQARLLGRTLGALTAAVYGASLV